MEEINVKGVVVRAADYGENDRLLTLITEERGKILATVKGGRSLKSRFLSVSEPFCLGVFGLRKKSKYFYLFDCDLIDDFYPVREDLERVSLASYICEIASELSLEGIPDEDLLKLTLNALYALAYKKEIGCEKIKSSYEFKAAVISGYMPDLTSCSVCGCEPEDDLFIDIGAGGLICRDCISKPGDVTGIGSSSVVLPLSPAALAALRFLEEAPIKKFLSYTINDRSNTFYNVCEKYLMCHLEKEFYTLNFYKSIK